MVELFVPGRLCLFGEHSDWAGAYRQTARSLSPGYCLVAATEQGFEAVAERASGVFEMQSVLTDGQRIGPVRIPARVDALDAVARRDGFFSYAAGVAAEVLRRHSAGGLRVRIASATLPIGRGLSSSAAACVLVARAFNRVYGLRMSPREEMELAYAGERRAGSACGLMDQICAFGRGVTLLTFDGDDQKIEGIVPGGPIHLLLVDLRRAKDTRRILRDLHACYPATRGRLAAGVREALGPRNAGLVQRARYAVLAADAPALGALMREAQEVFDRLVAPASPELAAPRLHAVLEHHALGELAWGAKGVGSQGDGAAQIVTRGPEERDELRAVLGATLGVECLPLTLGGRS